MLTKPVNFSWLLLLGLLFMTAAHGQTATRRVTLAYVGDTQSTAYLSGDRLLGQAPVTGVVDPDNLDSLGRESCGP